VGAAFFCDSQQTTDLSSYPKKFQLTREIHFRFVAIYK
jgi:hypothetical protein